MRASDKRQESFSFLRQAGASSFNPLISSDLLRGYRARGIFWGTLSWRYRGWEGLLYRGGYSSEGEFQREALREYSQVFSTVGVELSPYAWPTREQFGQLLDSTPEVFRFVLRVPNLVTAKTLPRIPALGIKGGQENPDFFSVTAFRDKFLAPLSLLGERLGALVFDFDQISAADLPRLRSFFEEVPRAVPMAAAFSHSEIESEKQFQFLESVRLGPAFILKGEGDGLLVQWARFTAFPAERSAFGPVVVMATLPPGRKAEEAAKRFSPYKTMQEPRSAEREGFLRLAEEASARGLAVFLLVHNHWEGCAPASLREILGSS